MSESISVARKEKLVYLPDLYMPIASSVSMAAWGYKVHFVARDRNTQELFRLMV